MIRSNPTTHDMSKELLNSSSSHTMAAATPHSNTALCSFIAAQKSQGEFHMNHIKVLPYSLSDLIFHTDKCKLIIRLQFKIMILS